LIFGVRDVIQELLHPILDAAILLAMLVFAILFTLSVSAGVLGLWLLLAIVPAFFQYLLVVVEARAAGKEAPAVGIELFSWVQNLWSLFPLVLIGAAAVLVFILQESGLQFLAGMAAALLMMLVPLSLAILALTHSPVECLRPTRLWLMASNWGRYYLLVLAVSLLAVLILYLVRSAGLPVFVTILATLYGFLLLASVSGHAIALQDTQIEMSIPDPVLPSARELEEQDRRSRVLVLNHAYGMVSRGNHAGGVGHVLEVIRNSSDSADEFRWYFTEMLRWDSSDAALLIGQQFISLLLSEGLEQEALKMIMRCRYVNPAFRLLEADRVSARRLADRRHDAELAAWLSS
jgi:hypothetical protein